MGLEMPEMTLFQRLVELSQLGHKAYKNPVKVIASAIVNNLCRSWPCQLV